MKLSLIIAAIFIFFLYSFSLLPMGFMSDDYLLIESARKGERLWHLHYSPILSFIWSYTTNDGVSAVMWRIAILVTHGVNTLLLYYFARYVLKMNGGGYAAAVALLFCLSPAGIEAIAWICCYGYVVTTTFLLLSLIVSIGHFVGFVHLSGQIFGRLRGAICRRSLLANRVPAIGLSRSPASNTSRASEIFDRKGEQGHFVEGRERILYLSLIQLLAFFTWDWALVIMPCTLLFVVMLHPKRLSQLLFPSLIFCTALILRATSFYDISWQENSLLAMVKTVLGSPLLGLAPNFYKSFYTSWGGLFSALFLWGAFIATSRRDAICRASLVSFFLSSLPWIFGGNISSRYYYLPMIFLYIWAISALAMMRQHVAAKVSVALFVAITALFAIERLSLWREAFDHKEKLYYAIADHHSRLQNGKSLALVDLPNAYGPVELAMRPQLWHGGIDLFFPNLHLYYSGSSDNVWLGGHGPHLPAKDALKDLTLYHIYWDGDHFAFAPDSSE